MFAKRLASSPVDNSMRSAKSERTLTKQKKC